MQSPRTNTHGLYLFLDIIERVLLAGLFSYFTWNLVHDWLNTGSIVSLLLVGSESAVLIFVLARRFTLQVSVSLSDWSAAFLGTALPLLAQPNGTAAFAPAAACVVLMIIGILIQVSAKLTLRRSFGVVAANRGVKVGGPYRLVRHPMYAGYFLTQIGFLLAHPTIWNVLVYCAAFTFQIGRIVAEERLLNLDASYRELSKVVPYRLLPGIY
jgi:protein-S-isoprenylcysteine O-methyltransferase Ste14